MRLSSWITDINLDKYLAWVNYNNLAIDGILVHRKYGGHHPLPPNLSNNDNVCKRFASEFQTKYIKYFTNIFEYHHSNVLVPSGAKKGEIKKSTMAECTSATTLMWTPAFMHWKLEFVLILFLPQLWCGLGTLPWQNAPGLWHWQNSPWGLSGIEIDILNFDFESDNDHGMAPEGY